MGGETQNRNVINLIIWLLPWPNPLKPISWSQTAGLISQLQIPLDSLAPLGSYLPEVKDRMSRVSFKVIV